MFAGGVRVRTESGFYNCKTFVIKSVHRILLALSTEFIRGCADCRDLRGLIETVIAGQLDV